MKPGTKVRIVKYANGDGLQDPTSIVGAAGVVVPNRYGDEADGWIDVELPGHMIPGLNHEIWTCRADELEITE